MNIYPHGLIGIFALGLLSIPTTIAAQQPDEKLLHQCSNGMVVELSGLSENEGRAFNLSFPSDETDQGTAVLEFVAMDEALFQTDRYVSEFGELTFGRFRFQLETRLAYKGQPIGSIECELVGPEIIEPVMQGGNKGRYFKLANLDRPFAVNYEALESACFFIDAPLVWAFVHDPEQDADLIALSSDGGDEYVERVTVSRLPAITNATQFRLTRKRSNSPDHAVAEFVPSASRDKNRPSATAGLVQILVPDRPEWRRCHENDNIVAMGFADEAAFIVSWEDNNLILEVDGLREAPAKRKIKNGRISVDNGVFSLNFFEGDTRFEFKVDPIGRAYASRVLVEGRSVASLAESPKFYFSANSEILASIDATMDNEIVKFLDERSLCRSLSEFSFGGDDPDERKAHLRQAREYYACAELSQRQLVVLQDLMKTKDDELYDRLRLYLKP